jgi:hypothetical protein
MEGTPMRDFLAVVEYETDGTRWVIATFNRASDAARYLCGALAYANRNETGSTYRVENLLRDRLA